MSDETVLERREWVYIQRPREYEISGCPCGNTDPDWSEFKRHLWCAMCKRDFIPEHNGVFDGPIPVNTSQLFGMSFDRINLRTQEIERCWPKRIQRKRTKGWKMPYATVYVGRPSKWGNPYMLNSTPTRAGRTEIIAYSREDAVGAFREWLEACNHRSTINHETVKAELRGKDLACWCRLDQPCHADVLLEIANSGAAGGNRQEPPR